MFPIGVVTEQSTRTITGQKAAARKHVYLRAGVNQISLFLGIFGELILQLYCLDVVMPQG
jgi:hypothetical protein